MGNKPDKFKVRKEVHLDKKTIKGLTKVAMRENKSLKSTMESILIEASKNSKK